MHSFAGVAPRRSVSIVSAARWNRRRRRIYFRLSNFGRAVASGMIGACSGLLEALHDSRSRLAVRLIDQHRDLVQNSRCMGGPDCTCAAAEVRKTELAEQ